MKKWMGLCLAMVVIFGAVGTACATSGTGKEVFTFSGDTEITTSSTPFSLSFNSGLSSGPAFVSGDTITSVSLAMTLSSVYDPDSYPLEAWFNSDSSVTENSSATSGTTSASYTFPDNVTVNWTSSPIAMDAMFDDCHGDLDSATLTIQYSSSVGEPAPTPEPATLLLVGSGLIGLATCMRKFKRA